MQSCCLWHCTVICSTATFFRAERITRFNVGRCGPCCRIAEPVSQRTFARSYTHFRLHCAHQRGHVGVQLVHHRRVSRRAYFTSRKTPASTHPAAHVTQPTATINNGTLTVSNHRDWLCVADANARFRRVFQRTNFRQSRAVQPQSTVRADFLVGVRHLVVGAFTPRLARAHRDALDADRISIAVRWTVSGFAFLLIAYLGSKFVLEILLQR